MIELKKVSCIICPLDETYISVNNCRICPYHVKDAGRTVECSYKYKKLGEEKASDEEYKTEW